MKKVDPREVQVFIWIILLKEILRRKREHGK
jgi:hypothetical protein